jgi:tetratricopeptide (TPR) repeat protein
MGNRREAEMAKYTDDDIKALAETIKAAEGNYAFLTGAGCSLSAGIPLASTLVGEIHKKYGETIKQKVDADNQQDYGACMGALTPTERKAILTPYLTKAKINWGHIALACMIKAGHIKRVLTFNFDPILTKACGLLGQYPAIYDFGVSAPSNVRFLSEPCIIHLHGQGTGQVMMNTDEETQSHAESLRPLFDDTLKAYNLVVIGYSGQADKAFPLIEAKLSNDKRLYWLGHDFEPQTHLTSLLSKPYCQYIGGSDADMVLIDLARKLGCFPPEIITDPAKHILEELDPIAEFPSAADQERDLLEDLKHRLKTRGDALKEVKLSQFLKDGDFNALLQQPALSPALKSWALFNKAYQLGEQGKHEEANMVYDEFIQTYKDDQAEALREIVAKAMFNKGVTLGQLKRSEEAIAVYDDLIQTYKDDQAEALREIVAIAEQAKALLIPDKPSKPKKPRSKLKTP